MLMSLFSWITTNATLRVSSYKCHPSSHGVLKKKICSWDFWCVDFCVVIGFPVGGNQEEQEELIGDFTTTIEGTMAATHAANLNERLVCLFNLKSNLCASLCLSWCLLLVLRCERLVRPTCSNEVIRRSWARSCLPSRKGIWF